MFDYLLQFDFYSLSLHTFSKITINFKGTYKMRNRYFGEIIVQDSN